MSLPQPDPTNSDRARGYGPPPNRSTGGKSRLASVREIVATTAPNATASLSYITEAEADRELAEGLAEGLRVAKIRRDVRDELLGTAAAEPQVLFRAEERARPEPGSVGGSLLGIDPWEYDEALRAEWLPTKHLGGKPVVFPDRIYRARLHMGRAPLYVQPIDGRSGAIEEWIENDPRHPYAITMRGLQGMPRRSADERRVRARPYEYRYADGYLAALARAYAWGVVDADKTKIIRVGPNGIERATPSQCRGLSWVSVCKPLNRQWAPYQDARIVSLAVAFALVDRMLPLLGRDAQLYVDASRKLLPVIRTDRDGVLHRIDAREPTRGEARALLNRELDRLGYEPKIGVGPEGGSMRIDIGPEPRRPLPLCNR